MTIGKTILVAASICAGLSAVFLWERSEADGSPEPLAATLVAQPSTIFQPAVAPPVEPPVGRAAVAAISTSVPPPPDALRRLRKALADGAVSSMDVQLSDVEAWDRFTSLWDEVSTTVRRAEDRRDDIGKRLARDRLAKGESTRIPAAGLETSENGHTKPVGMWRERRHPQEWVTNRVSYREGEGQIFEQVRIMPGENQELDVANLELALAIELRTEAVKRFFAQNMRATLPPSQTSSEESPR